MPLFENGPARDLWEASLPEAVWIVLQGSQGAQAIHSIWTTQAAATAIADAEERYLMTQYNARHGWPSRLPSVRVEKWELNVRKEAADGLESAGSRD